MELPIFSALALANFSYTACRLLLWDPEEVQAEELIEDGPNNLEDREDAGETLEAAERLVRMVGSTLEKREEDEVVVAFFSIGNDGSEKACP